MRKFCSFLSVLIVFCLLVIALTGSPQAIRKTEGDTLAYLLAQGHTQVEIVSIKGHYGQRDGDRKYYADVVLTKNVAETVVFMYDLDGKIYQVDSVGEKE